MIGSACGAFAGSLSGINGQRPAGISDLMANFEGGSGPLAMASAKGKVKWFNATKGYGFVTLDNGSDAFCHASALAALGQTDLPQGSTIVCDLQESPRGLQVVAIHSVDTSTAEPAGDRFGGGDEFLILKAQYLPADDACHGQP